MRLNFNILESSWSSFCKTTTVQQFSRFQVLNSARLSLHGPDSALEFVADHFDLPVKQLLTSHFNFIYPYMVVHAKNTAEFQKCCKFFEKCCKLDVQQVSDECDSEERNTIRSAESIYVVYTTTAVL